MSAPIPKLALRDEQPGDEAFLREVYASTRRQELEMAGLPKSVWAGFLDLQFRAQQQGYRATYPDAQFSIILSSGQSIGRMVVHRAADAVQLIDIALLPEHRGRGIGTELIRKLKKEASVLGVPLRLQVVRNERQARLYERLGFMKTGESDIRDQMEWRANNPTQHAIQSKTSPAI